MKTTKPKFFIRNFILALLLSFCYAGMSQVPFTLSSSTGNFQITCGHTVITVQANSTAPSAVSYTWTGPQMGATNGSSISVTNPGMYTVVASSGALNPSTQTFVVLSNTVAPDCSANVPQQILTCNTPSVQIQGTSSTAGVSYSFAAAGNPTTSTLSNVTTTANFANSNQTVVATWTLTCTDNSNQCKTATIIPIYQNIMPPHALISNGGINDLTCITPTVMLTNQSTSGIVAPLFPNNLPVIGYLWEAPVPQPSLSNLSTYTASAPGVYTLTAKDLNNGCLAKGTMTLGDKRFFPVLQAQGAYTVNCPGVVALTPSVVGNTNGLIYMWTGPAGANMTGITSPTVTTNAPGYYTVLVTNTLNGCSSQAVLSVFACVGIEEENKSSGLKLFPNPGNGIYTVYLENQTVINLKMYNALGSLIKEQEILPGTNELNIDTESRGVYYVEIFKGKDRIRTLKVIRQ